MLGEIPISIDWGGKSFTNQKEITIYKCYSTNVSTPLTF